MISVRGVNKSFGRVKAVQDVSIDIRQGEFFSLLGASGSGKTTLLRMIAGFEGVTSGTILIDGQEMQEFPPHLRPVNMVFQNYAIFPHLNVRDNIAYGLRRLGLPKDRQEAMVGEMLEMIALPGYGDRRANELSGGQQQRVALARALILKPKVLLLDEPLGALDKQLRQQMQLELRLLQQRLGITFLLVTHDQEEALTLSDRVAVMAAGRVVQVDTPSVLYECPHNRTVAGFIGSMNFFPGILRPSGEVEVVGLGQITVAGLGARHATGGAVTVAIRPEKLALTARKPEGRAVEGVVQAQQYLGGRHMLHVGLAGHRTPVAVALQETGDDMAQGQTVWMTWKDDAILILDADETGQHARGTR
ncbi:MAG: ABC transporter ATP-binding protein [Paracoccaceae bacterium]|nr:MAG: ABC transporter ATP-binding protein [Paracoccaceae bacterium]